MSLPLDHLVRQCCQCKRTEEEGYWKHRVYDTEPVYTHTYCPACLKVALLQISLIKLQRQAVNQ